MKNRKKDKNKQGRKKMFDKNKLSNIIILIIVIILVVGFFYVANLFSGEGGISSEKPVVFCTPENSPPEQQKCFYTAHEHMQLKIIIDGKEQDIEFEQGDLQKSHTHAEKNKIHWHTLLPIDPFTKNVTDWSPHFIRAALQELGFSDLGNDTIVIVNGNLEPEGLDYIWKDKDIIEVRAG